MKSNRTLEVNGIVKTLSEWSKIYNIGSKTVAYRINKFGWSAEAALTTPLMRNRKKKIK